MGVAADNETDATGPQGPVRTCVVTRTEHPVAELLRFALSPDGTVVPDLAGRLPGRGVWVVCARSAVAKAVKTQAFSRGFKQQASAPADLADLVGRLLVKRVLDVLSLANKAGLVLTGHTKVEAAVASGQPVALIQASDASQDGTVRLQRQFHAMCRDAGRTPHVVRNLSIDQLSLALGRENVVHAALKTGGVADLFLAEADRLQRFQAETLDSA